MFAMLPLAINAQKVWDYGDYKVTMTRPCQSRYPY